jgi:hypothetical protein
LSSQGLFSLRNAVFDTFCIPQLCQFKPDAMTMNFDNDRKNQIARFQFPIGVQARLNELLSRQGSGMELSQVEREEAEGLVDLAEYLTLLKLRIERVNS